MSVFQSQYTRALKVIPSDNANVPYPNLITSSLPTDKVSERLIDENANFITSNIQAGDIVYVQGNSSAATVLEVISATELLLNADIITDTSQPYFIYNASSQTSNAPQACYLYVGNAGDLTVTTAGQDIVTFFAVPAGTVLPIQVIKVHFTDTVAGKITALW
jgi:hypothetical protein